MLNRYSIIILLILLILVLLEFNTNYTISNNFKPNLNNKLGTLYIGTHNYEHKDIFITMKQFENYNDKFYMLFANKSWNYLLEPFRPKNIEFIYVKENTVQKLSSKLLLGYNVIMFLYYESESSGPFYILKNTKSPLILLKINKVNNKITEKSNKINNHYNSSFTEIYWNNLLAKFNLEIKQSKYYISKNTPCKIFIRQLKNKLYSTKKLRI
jgi:hypothetical protein